MARIYLETSINAPIERVFDLARSIELHKLSTRDTNEEAIAGRITGLINLDETVTWRAKHLGIYQELTVVITSMDRPRSFTDKMVKGAFASMEHIHRFEWIDGRTKMTDIFEFRAPLGVLGRLSEILFLKAYLKKFLLIRNREIKSIAESDRWRELPGMG